MPRLRTDIEQLQSFRQMLLIAAILYTGFVIYGSLVPLNYVPISLQEAWVQFAHIRFLNLGVVHRADWVANILLYIPLTLLWYGTLTVGQRSTRFRFFAMLLVMIVGVVLGVAIEFVQLFFPPRTVSINDVLAQSLGTGIGIAAWRPSRKLLLNIHSLFLDRNDRGTTIRIILLVYLVVLVAYNLMPLDLTISFTEIYHKWKQGRIILNPFHLDGNGLIKNLYALATDALIWIPPTIALALEFRYSALRIIGLIFAAVLGLELLQLIVYSRVSDVRDLLTGFSGAIAGLALARYTPLNRYTNTSDTTLSSNSQEYHRPLWAVTLAPVWFLLMLAVFWYPYNFSFEPTLIAKRLASINLVPFVSYYTGTEFSAVTELLHKVLFFMPLGALLGVLRLASLPALSFILVGAIAIEFGQLFMPGEIIDLGDLIFAAIGGLLGVKLSRVFLNTQQTAPAHDPQIPSNSTANEFTAETFPGPAPHQHAQSRLLRITLTYIPFVAVMGLLSAAVAELEVLPYNVRELFSPGRAGLTGALLACVIILAAITPVVSVSRLLNTNPLKSMLSYLSSIIVIGTLAWLLLWSAVPRESLHDILGSPILDWPWHFELLGRFLSLFIFYAVISSIGILPYAAAANRHRRRHHYTLRWILCASLTLPLSHWITVSNASTDNLTELMRSGGNWLSSSLIALWIMLIALNASVLIAGLHKRWFRFGLGLVFTVISFPLGFGLLQLGLENHVIKYGSEFSAMQFLLSVDRTHLATGSDLFLRFSLAQGLWLGALFFLILPWWPRTNQHAGTSRVHKPHDATGAVQIAINGTESPNEGAYRGIRLFPEQFAFISKRAEQMSLSVTEVLQHIIELDLRRSMSEREAENEQNSTGPEGDHGTLKFWDIWFPAPLVAELDSHAKQTGISVSRLSRDAVRRLMKKQ